MALPKVPDELQRVGLRLATSWPGWAHERRIIEPAPRADNKSPRLLFCPHYLPLLLLAALHLNTLLSPINQAECAGLAEANSTRTGDSRASAWSRELTNDLVKERAGPRKRNLHQQSGCDLLFSNGANEQLDDTKSDSAPADSLGRYCLCRDPLQAPPDSDERPASSEPTGAISQLDCRPDTLSQLTRGLAALAASKRSDEKTALQIDYLIVQTNLTGETTDSAAQRLCAQARPLYVDQLALTLSLRKPFEQPLLDRQLVGLVECIDVDHLQSLSVSLELEGDEEKRVNLDRLLNNLGALRRLEIEASAERDGAHGFGQSGKLALSLSSNSFKHQARLRWLNLASNQKILISDPGQLFDLLVNMEYLNLESSNLRQFHLFSLFQRPSNFRNLSSLNLSKNRLQTLGADLFCCSKGSSDKLASAHASFPSLNQLDLSYNQLHGVSLEEAQSILKTMPHLVHLYLQHNRIVHLQLDSLLLPAKLQVWPHSLVGARHEETKLNSFEQPLRASALDFIDLSHNRLTSLSTFNALMRSNSSARARLKSINLSHNQLDRPIDLFDSKFVDRLLFSQTFERPTNEDFRDAQLAHLGLRFDMANEPTGRRPSICDHLSAGGQSSEDSASEIALDHNRIELIDAHQFAGGRCATIELLRLDHNQINQINPDAFRWLINLRQLQLNDNRLDRLNSSRIFSANVRLSQLNLARNKIRALEGRVFEHLRELEQLDLSGNGLTDLTSELFANNVRLISLDLSRNKLTKLPASVFALKELRYLLVEANHLEEIAIRPRDSTTSLSAPATSEAEKASASKQPKKEVVMKKQKLGEIGRKRISAHDKRGQLRNKKAAKQRRQANGLVASDAYEMNPSVETGDGALILSSNQLATFHFGSLSSRDCSTPGAHFARSIKLLTLDRNFLQEITNETFARCLSGLETLDLSWNRLKTIHKSAFWPLQQLQRLDLAHNSLLSLLDGTFSPPQLVHLDLSDNRISAAINLIDMFKPDAASNSTKPASLMLESLDLSNNPRLELDTASLTGFLSLAAPTLRRLDLGDVASIETNLNQLPSTRVADRLELAELSISYRRNFDPKFQEFLWNENVSISRLNLRNQQPSQAFWTLITRKLIQNEVTELDLAGSQITNKQLARMFEQLSADNETLESLQLTRLGLSANLLDHWPLDPSAASKFRALRVLDLSSNKLTSLPEQISLLLPPELEVLDLSRNQLTWISCSSFVHPNGMIKSVNLSSNHLATLKDLASALWLEARANSVNIDVSHNANIDIQAKVHAYPNNSSRKLDLSAFEDLILSKNHLAQHQCESIQQFVDRHRSGPINQTSSYIKAEQLHDWQELAGRRTSSGNEQELEYLNGVEKGCALLIESVDTLNLSGSTLSSASLKSVAAQLQSPTSSRLIHLDLAQSRLNWQHFEPSNRVQLGSVAYLDLSGNELTRLQANFCANHALVNLKTLDLRGNQIETLNINSLSHCDETNHLDLSHNKVKSLVFDDNAGNQINLLVLKLNNNKLTQLDPRLAAAFPLLRHLDVSANHISVLDRLPRVLATLRGRYVYLHGSQPDNLISDLRLEDGRESSGSSKNLQLVVDDNAVKLISSRPDGKYSLQLSSLDKQTLVLSAEPNASHVIRFCTLDRNQTHRACLNTPQEAADQFCFLLRAPPLGPKCLTNLDDELTVTSLTKREDANRVDQQHLSSTDRLESKQIQVEETGASDDAILSLIENLKTSWLRLKQFDLGAYLVSVSRIQEDSILMKLNDKHPIYTLTVIKAGLVVAAACIILLSIAMFALLSSSIVTNGRQLKRKSSSSEGETARQRDDTSPQLPTSATTLSTNDNSMSFSTDDTNTRSKEASSASKESERRDKMQTREAAGKRQLLDANQLLNEQQQQQAQACSTPSSSIAQSGSFETVETMQAVDSLQGSNVHSFNTNQSGELAEERTPTNDGHSMRHLHQQPHLAATATVMRMVKSNSAQTFDRRPRAPPRVQPYGNQYAYGALSAAQAAGQTANQPFWQHQAPEQIYIPQSMSFVASTLPHRHYELQAMRLNEQEPDELDPTTLSLLSINTQLSSHGYGAGGGAKLSPQPPQQQQADQLIAAPGVNLCQHHTAKLLEQQQQHQRRNQVIFEQEELELGASQLQQQLQPQSALFDASAVPPPPLSPSLYHYQGQ